MFYSWRLILSHNHLLTFLTIILKSRTYLRISKLKRKFTRYLPNIYFLFDLVQLVLEFERLLVNYFCIPESVNMSISHLCELTTREHKLNMWFYTQKPVWNVRLKTSGKQKIIGLRFGLTNAVNKHLRLKIHTQDTIFNLK